MGTVALVFGQAPPFVLVTELLTMDRMMAARTTLKRELKRRMTDSLTPGSIAPSTSPAVPFPGLFDSRMAVQQAMLPSSLETIIPTKQLRTWAGIITTPHTQTARETSNLPTFAVGT